MDQKVEGENNNEKKSDMEETRERYLDDSLETGEEKREVIKMGGTGSFEFVVQHDHVTTEIDYLRPGGVYFLQLEASCVMKEYAKYWRC